MKSRLKRNLPDEIEYIRCNATGMLVNFLKIISIRYQIDNFVNIIEGMKNKVNIVVLIKNTDPDIFLQ